MFCKSANRRPGHELRGEREGVEVSMASNYFRYLVLSIVLQDCFFVIWNSCVHWLHTLQLHPLLLPYKTRRPKYLLSYQQGASFHGINFALQKISLGSRQYAASQFFCPNSSVLYLHLYLRQGSILISISLRIQPQCSSWASRASLKDRPQCTPQHSH